MSNRNYSTDYYGEHIGGTRIVGHGAARALAKVIASSMTADARASAEPVAWVTGNSYMPPLRSFPEAERVWQADNGARSSWPALHGAAIWDTLVEEVERLLAAANVYMSVPDYDNAVYCVDMNRWQYREDGATGDDINDEWEERPVLHFRGFPPIRGTGPVITAIEEDKA
ncbi:MAG TPA: hypothetical protein VGG75_37905 [Trebonia sp.]|jgi:hypothetical protein